MNSKVKNFKCPFCERQYNSLDDMYNCAKNDEQIAKHLERKNEEERKRKQLKEQSSILSQKLEDINREIDKYNQISDGINSPKIEKIYKFNFVRINVIIKINYVMANLSKSDSELIEKTNKAIAELVFPKYEL